MQVEFYVNENTFKERLKLFFIKNQRSSECREPSPALSRGTRSHCHLLVALSPRVPSPGPDFWVLASLVWGMLWVERTGCLLPPLLPGDSHSVTKSCDTRLGAGWVSGRECPHGRVGSAALRQALSYPLLLQPSGLVSS